MADRREIQLTERPQLREEVTTRVILSAKAARPSAADNIRELETRLQPGVPDRIRRGTPPRDPGLGEPPPVPCPSAPPTFVWNPCDALPARAAPVYNAYFAQENYLQGVEMPALPIVIHIPTGFFSFDLRLDGPGLLGVPLTKVIARFGACAFYTQSWFVTDVRIGDLEAVRGLAPAEEVELELRSSVTTRTERTAAANEQIDQTSETVRSNKEIQEAMQTAAIDGGWSSSSSSSYRLGLRFLWLNFGGGDSSSEASQQFSRASSQTLQSLRETVSRATEAVKASAKIEVRGVRETVVSERNVRRFRNPYYDRSLLIKVFSVFKSYRISTSRSAVRLGLTFDVESFDKTDYSVRRFAQTNREFLGQALLDTQLRAKLDDALLGIREGTDTVGAAEAALVDAAKKALLILFDDFLTDPVDPARLLPLADDDTLNLELQRVTNSFFARPPNFPFFEFGDAGITEAKNKDALDLYMILYVLFQQFLDVRGTPALDEKAVGLTTAAAKAIDTWWVQVTPENRSDAYKSSEEEDFAEIFRRLPGFRAYYDEFVAPLLMRRSADEQLRAEQDARRQLAGQLVAHLTQFSGYYTQGFLHWSARTLGPSLFAAEVQSWLGWAFWGAGVSVPSSLLKALVPPESIALRDNAVIVSGWYDIEVIAELHAALAAANNAAAAELVALIDTIYGPAGTTPPEPTCVDVDLPIDGAYVEPVAGTCVLEDVPPPPPPAPVPPIP